MGRLEKEIISLIDLRYGSRAGLARKLGMPVQSIYSALGSSITSSAFSTVMPIAEALDLNPFELARGNLVEAKKSKGSVDVPFFGSIAAGQPIEASEAEDSFPIPASLHESYPNAFMLRVEGTSMNRVLPDGHFALVDPCDTVETSGQLYAVAIGDGAVTIKHVRLLSNGLELCPDSDDPTHHPMLFDYADKTAPEVRVIGRVVWHCPPV